MKNVVGLIVGIILVIGGYFVLDYTGVTKVDRIVPGAPQVVNEKAFETMEEATEVNPPEAVDYELEVFAENLFVPWSIVFTSPQRVLVTERSGNLRVIENGQLLSEPFAVFDEVSSTGEEGLMGLTLHPDYDENGWIYLSMAYPKQNGLVVKVVRFVDEGDRLSDETVILDDIPAAQFHAGSRIKFGPDKKLYVTTGDATDGQLAQQMDSLAGKVLRMNDDGTVPDDNPFQGSLVYTFGHRNPQGIAWYPDGTMYSTEHGPSVFDGPAGGDEVNVLLPGLNYGWPLVSHENNKPGLEAPKLVFTPAVAPASGMFYTSDVFPQFKNSFFFGLLKGEGIMRVVVDENNPQEVVSFEKLAGIDVGRVRDVVEGPDGAIYFSTSNRDGRGTVHSGDDKIYRLVPVI